MIFEMLVILFYSINCFVECENDPNLQMPFNGAFYNLTLKNLSSRYQLHIIEQRPHEEDRKLEKYIHLNTVLRDTTYNGDCGSAEIFIDNEATFQAQTNCKRTELVRTVNIAAGSIFVRFSILVEKEFNNTELDYQVGFLESHKGEVRIQQKGLTTPEIRILNDSNPNAVIAKFPFEYRKYHNFGIEGNLNAFAYYYSIDDTPLEKVGEAPYTKLDPNSNTDGEVHFGLLSYMENHTPIEPDSLILTGVTIVETESTSAEG
uniref:Uncharacterized protein AlNc14C3G484 n=1 Tax=Albugo laibachii Nc14 TaxID=890382 RepID=F0W006_9STRA|nr:conserved hypothetical protein [Albugo laibachii Nc14]|eukprot:CCA14377.1 conserved hypothetical protein [Albugo laibachii Nc14]